MAKEGSRHLGEGTLNQIGPGTLLGCVNVFESSRTSGQVGCGLLGGVGRVVVQHDADDGLLRIVLVQSIEQRDKLHAAVPVLDVGEDLSPSAGRFRPVSSPRLYGRLQEYKTFLIRGKGAASLYSACFAN